MQSMLNHFISSPVLKRSHKYAEWGDAEAAGNSFISWEACQKIDSSIPFKGAFQIWMLLSSDLHFN